MSVNRVAELYDRFPVPAGYLAEAVARRILPVANFWNPAARVPERVAYICDPGDGVILRVAYI